MKQNNTQWRTLFNCGRVRGIFAAMLAAGALWCAVPEMSAAKPQDNNDKEETVDLSDLTLDETLLLPAVGEKQAPYIRNYMNREAQGLEKLGYKVETMRKGEVVVATIPADELFAPNDTTLLPSAGNVLKPFLPYFRIHGKFRVVLAMHSDDTGSAQYLLDLTEKRIISLYDFFDGNASQTDMLQGYPMGSGQPVKGHSNATRDERRGNRRLEIYIVPGPMLLMDAKAKKL